MELEELQHFAHNHPLKLLPEEYSEIIDGDNCSACDKPVSGPFYLCLEYGPRSLFCLHKSCAELPAEMNHFGHPDHPLTLFHPKDREEVECDACDWWTRGIVYRCSACEFYLDIGCSQLPNTVEHKLLHNHPLSLQLKGSDHYRCDACGCTSSSSSGSGWGQRRMLSYQCASCHFWVHPECVSLPSSVERPSCHLHPLALVSASDKLEISRFKIYCQICDRTVKRKDCAYCCTGCRYFAHVGCATSKEKDIMPGKVEPGPKDASSSDQISLPTPDESSSLHLLNHLLEQVSLLASNESGKGLKHSHCDHQLTHLFDAQIDEKCDACVLPIAAPYYKCSKCHLILHKSCAELPTEIRHLLHERHPLHLLHHDHHRCFACGREGNGFAYCCEVPDCYFVLDIKCASLPTAIRHEAHDHVLKLLELISYGERCNACHQDCHAVLFHCGGCNFNLHVQCALLPRTLRHRYDRHAIILKYSPVGIKSNEHYCELCEDEVNTNPWFYYCADCDYAFHSGCLCTTADKYANLKLGAIIKVENHPHSLTLARLAMPRQPPCDKCGKTCEKIVLECRGCNFNLHYHCR